MPTSILRTAPLWTLLLCTLLGLPGTDVQAAPTTSADADGGLARRYFSGLPDKPLSFVRSKASRPNFLWIVVDAMRPDHLGLYGYDKPTTPFLDAWSQDAFVFVNHHANSPWTRPSTTSMLTGLYPSAHRTQSDRSRLPDGIPTVAEELRRRGYRTAAVVGNGNAGRVTNLHRGFDLYIDTVSHWDGLPAAGDVYAAAEGLLAKLSKGKKPWFLFVFLVDPHDPYHAPPAYEREWLGDHAGEPRRRAHWEYKNNYSAADRNSMIALYDAALRYTDDQTRKFFAAADALGATANTTTLITSDHGEGFGEHGYYLHSYHHHDEFLRVPLMIKSPAWKGQGQVFSLTQSVDLMPTLLAQAGVRARPELVGRDLGEVLARPVNRGRVALSEYNEFGIRRSSLFNLDHKVILQLPADREAFLARIPRPELLPSVSFDREVVQVYDRQRDPQESKALKNRPAGTEEMVRTLREYMQQAPRSNQDVDLKKMPQAVIDDLRSLGYVQ